MAVIKVACSKCGQRVSGDESFYGTTVQCPICTSEIRFPSGPGESSSGASHTAERTPQNAAPVLPAQHQPLPQGYGLPAGPIMPVASPGSPYGQPPARGYSAGVPPVTNSPMPLVVMIFGIASVVICPLSVLLGPATIIMGHLTLMKHNADARLAGKGKTITGLVLGYVSLLFLVVGAVLWRVVWPAFQESVQP